MWKLFCVIFVQVMITNKVSAQIPVPGLYSPQSQPRVLNQQQNVVTPLLMSFLNKRPMPERIETVANALQRSTPRMAGRKNKRHEMADFLKKTALQSLMVASNACKVCNKDLPVERVPVRNPMGIPRSVPNDMPRPVKMQYL